MWNIEKTVRVNPHAAAADSHSNKEKKTDMLILKTELPRSSVQHEFDIPAASIQRLGIFRQQWLKTLPAESAITTYLSSGISTSEKFQISMAHLLDPKGSVMTPPCWTSASICNVSVWTSATCQMLKWGHVNSLHGRAHARLRALTPAPHLMKAAQLESQGRHPGALCSRSPLIIQQQPCSLRRPGQRWSKNMQMFTFKSHIIRN